MIMLSPVRPEDDRWADRSPDEATLRGLLVDLCDPSATTPGRVGRRAATLAQLSSQGLAVAPGAVLTASATWRLARSGVPDVDYRIPGSDPAGPPEPPIQAALARAWHEAGHGGLVPVSVSISPRRGGHSAPIRAESWNGFREALERTGQTMGTPSEAILIQRGIDQVAGDAQLDPAAPR